MGEAIEESERVLAILRTLLDISEAEHGTMRLRVDSVELAPLAAAAVDLYAHVAEKRGVRVHVEVPAGLRAMADPVRVQQVLSNLFQTTRSSIAVRAAPCTLPPGTVTDPPPKSGCPCGMKA